MLVRDGGRPSRVAVQAEVLNRRLLCSLRDRVVSETGKGRGRTLSGTSHGVECK